MDEKTEKNHRVVMENRQKSQFTGIREVISFDEKEVLLETSHGILTVRGEALHVSRLTVEKGELDLDGKIHSFVYQETDAYRKPGESLFRRLLR